MKKVDGKGKISGLNRKFTVLAALSGSNVARR
jgi:hypothetical protein